MERGRNLKNLQHDFFINAMSNKSMDVRAKQRLSYQPRSFPRRCVYSVSPHVISSVIHLPLWLGKLVMMRIFLLLGLLFASVSLATSQTDLSQVKATIFNIPNLPVSIKDATFDNLEYRADFNYSVTNLTDDEIWNYEVVLFFFDSKEKTISKKLEICVEFVIDKEAERCRYFPPGALIESGKTEEIGVVLNERVEPGTKVVAAFKEVRGSKGIWQIDDAKLQSAVQSYAQSKTYQSLEIKKTNHITLTELDKLEIIKPTLERALFNKQIPDYGLLKDKANVVLSTKNISPNLVPKLTGVNLILLSPDKIQEKADSEGDFTYLSFGEITANGDKIFVVLANTWVKSKTSHKVYMSGGAMFLEYRKENSKWIGEIVGGWIS